jgi:hypothetical protein
MVLASVTAVVSMGLPFLSWVPRLLPLAEEPIELLILFCADTGKRKHKMPIKINMYFSFIFIMTQRYNIKRKGETFR